MLTNVLTDEKGWSCERLSVFPVVDQVIYKTGEGSCDFYAVLTGRVGMSINSSSDPVATLVDGSHFGELEAIRGTTRVSTAVALEHTHVVRIQQRVYKSTWPYYGSHREFLDFLGSMPGFRMASSEQLATLYYTAPLRRCGVGNHTVSTPFLQHRQILLSPSYLVSSGFVETRLVYRLFLCYTEASCMCLCLCACVL